MPSEVHRSPAPEPRGSRRSWLVPAGAFVAGCALGGVLVGAAAGGDDGPDPPPSATAQGPDGAADVTEEPSAAGDPGLYVRVPDACVRTADGATALVEQVDRIVEAVAALEPEPLRRSVDDVQQVRDSVQDVAAQCRAEAARRLEGADAGAAPQTSASS